MGACRIDTTTPLGSDCVWGEGRKGRYPLAGIEASAVWSDTEGRELGG